MCIANTVKQEWEDEELLRFVRERGRLRRPVFPRIWQHRGDTDDSDSAGVSDSMSSEDDSDDSGDDARFLGYEDRDVGTVDRERPPSPPMPWSPPSPPEPTWSPIPSSLSSTTPWSPEQGPNPFWSCECPFCSPPPAEMVEQGLQSSRDDSEPMAEDGPSGSPGTMLTVSGSNGTSSLHKRSRSPTNTSLPPAKRIER